MISFQQYRSYIKLERLTVTRIHYISKLDIPEAECLASSYCVLFPAVNSPDGLLTWSTAECLEHEKHYISSIGCVTVPTYNL